MAEGMFLLLALLSGHFVADFALQTDAQAKGKSSSMRALLSHVLVYTVVMSALAACGLGLSSALAWFAAITFVSHAATDYVTSRINKRLWEQGRVHDFFVGIGADQLIHAWTLALTWLAVAP